MISSIIKQVRDQKKAIMLNHELKKDQDLNLMSNNPDVYQSSQADMPPLSQQANQLDQFLPELVELKQVVDQTANGMNEVRPIGLDRVDPALSQEAKGNIEKAAMPLKNDFIFNFDAYENHRREIQEKHLQRNSARDGQIAEILNAKAEGDGAKTEILKHVTFADTLGAGKSANDEGQDMNRTLPGESVLQRIEDHSHTLMVSRAAEQRFQDPAERNIVGSNFTY